MAIYFRLFLPPLAALTLALLWNVPRLVGWDEDIAVRWLALLQLAGPAVAAALGGVAARRSTGRAATAWWLFTAGSLLYVSGNLFYIAAAMIVGHVSFPTVPEAAFFVMALLFAAGVSQYARDGAKTPAIIFYNFVLLYGAVVICCLFLLHHAIKQSQLSELATIVAFLYPALWCSVAMLSAALVVLFPRARHRVPLMLLTLAFAAEAAADSIYALQLMAGSYELGGWPHVLWMASTFLIAWAAVEHMQVAPADDRFAEAEPDRPDNSIAQVLMPAVILLAILVAGSVTGAFGIGMFGYLAGAFAVVLAATVALREYWIVDTRKRLLAVAAERLSKLVESEHRLTSVLEATSDSVVVVDRDWRISFFNKRAVRLIPELESTGIGRSLWDLLPSGSRDLYEGQFRGALETGNPWESEVYDDAHGRWLDVRGYPTGEGLSFFFRDISEQRRIRREIEHLAHHDFLTGLSSRAVFRRKLDAATIAAQPLGLLLLDLDHFKEINDTLGHAVGDAVLVQVAERLKTCAPSGSMVARLGGDEFAIILDDLPADDLVRLSRRILDELCRPYQADGQSLLVGASIGVARGVAEGADDDLLKRADIALYEAKAEKRGDVVVFEPQMEVRLRDRKALLNDLARAIEDDELELAYQPLVDADTGRTVAFEALLRWRNPTRGLTPPDVFIPLAEESGLIVAIGDWALRAACAEAMNWPASISVSVNLSTRQFADDLVERIVTALADTGFDHRRLELEVTESALMRAHNLPLLKDIQDLGIRLALDDFGTGYSSLSYLQRFRFDKLKIDRSFIAGVPARPQSKAIVRTVVDLARALGMWVTAEGVETREQYDWIARHCDEVQGYVVAKPMPGADIPAWLAAEKRRMRVRKRA